MKESINNLKELEDFFSDYWVKPSYIFDQLSSLSKAIHKEHFEKDEANIAGAMSTLSEKILESVEIIIKTISKNELSKSVEINSIIENLLTVQAVAISIRFMANELLCGAENEKLCYTTAIIQLIASIKTNLETLDNYPFSMRGERLQVA